MHQGLIRVILPDKRGTPRAKWVRPEGVDPPSQSNEYRRAYYHKKRAEVLDALGTECVRCGYSDDIRALCVDHVKGDGYKDRGKTGVAKWCHVLKNLDTSSYQILCANCNTIKREEEDRGYRNGTF